MRHSAWFFPFSVCRKHVVLAYSNALGSKIEHVIGHLNAANNLNFCSFHELSILMLFSLFEPKVNSYLVTSHIRRNKLSSDSSSLDGHQNRGGWS